jgi:hypothetical protein
MTNTSATGGPLVPGPGVYSYSFLLATDPTYWANSQPPDGQSLDDFMAQMVVGITQLPSHLVRPLYQEDPPELPPHGTDWMNVGVMNTELDPGWPWEFSSTSAQVPLDADGNQLGLMTERHETFDLLCSSYGPRADWFDGLIRDGFPIGQNQELLLLTGMALVRVGGRTLAPEYLRQRWVRRVDRRIKIHRALRRLYPILNVLTATGDILRDNQTEP